MKYNKVVNRDLNSKKQRKDSAKSRKKTVVFLRSNPVAPDPRVDKEASALEECGFNTVVIAWDRKNQFPRHERIGRRDIYRVKVKAGIAKGFKTLGGLIKWNICLLYNLVKYRNRYQVIHACDFDTIIPAVFCKLLFRKTVVYDVFDFYADMLRKAPNWLRRIIRRVDLFLMQFVDAVIIADDSRLKQIEGAKYKQLVVIYNSPHITLQLDGNEKKAGLVVGYVGLLQKERGIFEMIEVIKNHPEWQMVIGGYGAEEDEVRLMVEGSSNVKFVGQVPYEETMAIYSNSDVIFATYDPSIPNHKYSSANKLFEAMMLGIPIIVARGTGMDEVVRKYDLGFVVEYGNKNQLEDVLVNIASWDVQKKREFSERARRVFQENFSWEIMEKRLTDLYEKILGCKLSCSSGTMPSTPIGTIND
ncbi:MAG TPA: glycosyltransferase family 4 protein [Clostridiales bacterium]|nr:glycosyltransferase family 4 protein [Clostridiales bacterium]